MSNKFSHRRTRVQHKPKVCISKHPRKPPEPQPGLHLDYAFRLRLGIGSGYFNLYRDGTIVGTLNSAEYLTNGLDDDGLPWSMTVIIPATGAAGRVDITTNGPACIWTVGLPGWIPPLPHQIDPIALNAGVYPNFGTWSGTLRT